MCVCVFAWNGKLSPSIFFEVVLSGEVRVGFTIQCFLGFLQLAHHVRFQLWLVTYKSAWCATTDHCRGWVQIKNFFVFCVVRMVGERRRRYCFWFKSFNQTNLPLISYCSTLFSCQAKKDDKDTLKWRALIISKNKVTSTFFFCLSASMKRWGNGMGHDHYWESRVRKVVMNSSYDTD